MTEEELDAVIACIVYYIDEGPRHDQAFITFLGNLELKLVQMRDGKL